MLRLSAALSSILALSCGTALAADLAIVEPAPAAAGLPAVSAINGKLDFGKVHFDFDEDRFDNGGFYGIGTVTVPLSHAFGFQLDAGALQMHDDAHQEGIAGHLFWRDPSVGLLGGYAEYVDFWGRGFEADIASFGVEAEAYLGQISLEGFAGADHVSGRNVADDGTSGRFEGRIAWYATDDLRLEIGGGHRFDESYLAAGVEAAIPAYSSVSAYANATFGEDGAMARAGVRIYLGESGKALKARHREDDPQTRLFTGAPSPEGSQPREDECKPIQGFTVQTALPDPCIR